MAHKVHTGQQFADFGDIECAIGHYQNSENARFFKRDSKSLVAEITRAPNKAFNDKVLRDLVLLLHSWR